MKVANAPSSLTAFFLYKKPDFAQELDIEIFNDPSGRSGSRRTRQGADDGREAARVRPDRGVPRVRDRVRPGSVRFLVDGVELQRFTSGVTQSSMYLHVNAWFPSWLRERGRRTTSSRTSTGSSSPSASRGTPRRAARARFRPICA
jgi:hypothetical protein